MTGLQSGSLDHQLNHHRSPPLHLTRRWRSTPQPFMCCHTSIPQPKTCMFGRLPTSIQEGDQLKDHNSYLLTFQPQGHRQHVEGVEGFPAVDCVEMVKSVSAHLLTPPRQCTRGGDHLETPPLAETSGTVVASNHISSPLMEASTPASAPNSPCRPWWQWKF